MGKAMLLAAAGVALLWGGAAEAKVRYSATITRTAHGVPHIVAE